MTEVHRLEVFDPFTWGAIRTRPTNAAPKGHLVESIRFNHWVEDKEEWEKWADATLELSGWKRVRAWESDGADVIRIREKGDSVNEGVAKGIAQNVVKTGLDAFQVACLDTMREYNSFEGESLVYAALGLANEAGEALGKIKKVIRDSGGLRTLTGSTGFTLREQIAMEVGDTLWYAMVLLDELDVDAGDIGVKLLEKLADRKKRGVITGNGDDR